MTITRNYSQCGRFSANIATNNQTHITSPKKTVRPISSLLEFRLVLWLLLANRCGRSILSDFWAYDLEALQLLLLPAWNVLAAMEGSVIKLSRGERPHGEKGPEISWRKALAALASHLGQVCHAIRHAECIHVG